MDCTLVVRSRNSIRQWEVDDWTVLAVIASLSAEPETDNEFITAIERYGVEHRMKYRGQKLTSIPPLSFDQNWCFIDLVGQSIVSGGELQLPPHDGAFQKEAHDPPGGSRVVWLALPAAWQMQSASDNWVELVDARLAAKLSEQRCDVRGVLFGPPLIEHLVQGVLRAVRDQAVTNEEEEMRLTRGIHAEWLMTARGDLNRRTPRELLLEKCETIDHEYFQRTQQWTAEGKPPPPLDENSSAYRFGGFGTIQIVFYFEMIRALLSESWHCIRSNPAITAEELRQKLTAHQQSWLDSPDEESDGDMTPRQWIEAERRRLPVTINNAMVDCDCPICQAQADGDFGMGIGFEMIDAHRLELENEFAFSTIKDRGEWEAEQEAFETSVAEMNARQALGEAELDEANGGIGKPVWQSTFVDWDSPPILSDPLAEGAMRIGFCLAEIIGDLKRIPEGRAQLVRLNNAYRDFRRSESLIVAREAALQLCKELEETAEAYPDLVAKSSDLQSRIHEVLRSNGS